MYKRNKEISEKELVYFINKNVKNYNFLVSTVGIDIAAKFYSYCNNIESIEDFENRIKNMLDDMNYQYNYDTKIFFVVQQIIFNAEENILQNKMQALLKKKIKFERKITNRSMYLPEVTFIREVSKSGKIKKRWRGVVQLRSHGLMKQASEYLDPSLEKECILFPIEFALPDEKETENLNHVFNFSEDINPLIQENITVSGSRLAWKEQHISYKWLVKLFPDAIDFRAYNHSLNSPLIPGSFLPETKVKICTIKTIDKDRNTINANTDGCGRIHPEHPIFASMERPGQICAFQFRAINKAGLFLKGILVPDERCLSESGEPEIWFDWNQVKGAHKNKAKVHVGSDYSIYTTVFLGAIQAWDRRRTLKLSFEQLQIIKRNEFTESIIDKWLEQNYSKLLGDSPERLLISLSRESESMNSVLRLITYMNSNGANISPFQIPMIRNAAKQKLQKAIYHLAQGAGKSSRQLVAVIDDGVPEGYYVAKGVAPETEAVVYRYPTLLPQSLLRLKAYKPLKHHYIKKQVLDNVIYMNSKDLVDKIQGDSDGDIVGLSTDPHFVQLTEHTYWDGKYRMVEPEGLKLSHLKSDSASGKHYIAQNPRGPVGIMCILQAKLFAIGDIEGAIALSFCYQEAVDMFKKQMKFTDYVAASDLDAWEFDSSSNRYHFAKRFENVSSEMDVDEISKWVSDRIASKAFIEEKEQENILIWRKSSKAIDIDSWPEADEDAPYFNLTNYCNNKAKQIWKEKYSQNYSFNFDTVDISNLIQLCMKLKEGNHSFINMSWKEYNTTIRNTTGINQYIRKISAIYSNKETIAPGSDLIRNRVTSEISILKSKLVNCDFKTLELIWRMENTPTWGILSNNRIVDYVHEEPKSGTYIQLNKPNVSFRAICFENSPIMNYFEISDNSYCNWLYDDINGSNRITKIMELVFMSKNPSVALTNIIYHSKKHGDSRTSEQGSRVELCECKTCIKMLSDFYVAVIRSTKENVENNFIKEFSIKFNNKK